MTTKVKIFKAVDCEDNLLTYWIVIGGDVYLLQALPTFVPSELAQEALKGMYMPDKAGLDALECMVSPELVWEHDYEDI